MGSITPIEVVLTGVAAHFFSRLENEAYFGLDPRDRPLGFFNARILRVENTPGEYCGWRMESTAVICCGCSGTIVGPLVLTPLNVPIASSVFPTCRLPPSSS